MRRRDGVVVEIVVASSDGRRSGNRLADRSVQRQTSQRATCWARWGWLSGKMARPFYSILAAPNQPLPLPNHQAQESAMSVLSTSVSVVSIFLPSRHRPPRSRHDLETRSAGCRSDRRVALSEKRTNTAIWFSIARTELVSSCHANAKAAAGWLVGPAGRLGLAHQRAPMPRGHRHVVPLRLLHAALLRRIRLLKHGRPRAAAAAPHGHHHRRRAHRRRKYRCRASGARAVARAV